MKKSEHRPIETGEASDNLRLNKMGKYFKIAAILLLTSSLIFVWAFFTFTDTGVQAYGAGGMQFNHSFLLFIAALTVLGASVTCAAVALDLAIKPKLKPQQP